MYELFDAPVHTDLPAFEHQFDALHVLEQRDVLQGVAVHGDQVGELARRDSPKLAL